MGIVLELYELKNLCKDMAELGAELLTIEKTEKIDTYINKL